jgi:hypothetical protein
MHYHAWVPHTYLVHQASTRSSIQAVIQFIFILIFTGYTETVIDASKEVGLEVNAEKTRYILLSRHQTAGQNHDIKIGNRSFENVAQFEYLGTTVTNQNLIQKDIK